MGYAVLHLDKAAGNEVKMTAHIERTQMPANAVPTLTYLNEELIEFPEGVTNRTEAIQHRLDTAGLTRKIGTNPSPRYPHDADRIERRNETYRSRGAAQRVVCRQPRLAS